MKARLEIVLEGRTLDIFVKMSKDSGMEIKELINLYVIKMAEDYADVLTKKETEIADFLGGNL